MVNGTDFTFREESAAIPRATALAQKLAAEPLMFQCEPTLRDAPCDFFSSGNGFPA